MTEDAPLPPGFEYRSDFVTPDEERELAGRIATLPFTTVELRGQIARRRTAHFGVTYGYADRRIEPGPPIPDFLLAVRSRSATWAGIDEEDLAESLVTEYKPGAPIGWHRDAPMFGDVIAGISLLASCRMKFRPYVPPSVMAASPPSAPRRATHEIELAPRSAYLISGSARNDFEHHIPAVDALRYSVTFRTLKSSRVS